MTISIVRTISFTIYTSSKRMINASAESSTATSDPWLDIRLDMFNSGSAADVATTSGLAGAVSGAVICFGSAPFELVKVGANCWIAIKLTPNRSDDSWNTKSGAIPIQTVRNLSNQ